MEQVNPQAALASAGIPRAAATLAQLARPSIRLTSRRADEASLAIGASKLGGLPDLPPDVPWPARAGAPLAFVAQVRLDDVAPFDVTHVLPATGLLTFFYDARQQAFGADPADRGAWQVLYDAGAAERLRRMSAPDALPAAA
nr:DUF1963 domain-containing protein [Ktedonobacterales bacterium]